jgi:chromosome segregation ATPase
VRCARAAARSVSIRSLAARRIIVHISPPRNERLALERERDELPAQIADYWITLEATPADFKERRERLQWQIRRLQKRLAEVEARLATIRAEPP